jgi:hypothetical protein
MEDQRRDRGSVGHREGGAPVDEAGTTGEPASRQGDHPHVRIARDVIDERAAGSSLATSKSTSSAPVSTNPPRRCRDSST